MRSNKNLLLTLLMLVVVAALYRVIPARPFGFAPHLAMALFGGAVIKDKRLAIAFPVLSMFISDLFYHVLYINGISEMAGFYDGQMTNYLLFAGMTLFGFLMKKINVLNIAAYSVIVCTAFYILSNFFVWNSGGGWSRPHTFSGMLMAYADGLPFYGMSIIATIAFSAVLFGAWKLMNSSFKALVHQ
jgi:hypothetical protein